MISMVTKQAHVYAGKKLRAGDEFVASKQDARLLVALGRAERKQETSVEVVVPHETPRVYKTRAIKVDKPKRQYRRRDLVAQE